MLISFSLVGQESLAQGPGGASYRSAEDTILIDFSRQLEMIRAVSMLPNESLGPTELNAPWVLAGLFYHPDLQYYYVGRSAVKRMTQELIQHIDEYVQGPASKERKLYDLQRIYEAFERTSDLARVRSEHSISGKRLTRNSFIGLSATSLGAHFLWALYRRLFHTDVFTRLKALDKQLNALEKGKGRYTPNDRQKALDTCREKIASLRETADAKEEEARPSRWKRLLKAGLIHSGLIGLSHLLLYNTVLEDLRDWEAHEDSLEEEILPYLKLKIREVELS